MKCKCKCNKCCKCYKCTKCNKCNKCNKETNLPVPRVLVVDPSGLLFCRIVGKYESYQYSCGYINQYSSSMRHVGRFWMSVGSKRTAPQVRTKPSVLTCTISTLTRRRCTRYVAHNVPSISGPRVPVVIFDMAPPILVNFTNSSRIPTVITTFLDSPLRLAPITNLETVGTSRQGRQFLARAFPAHLKALAP